MATFSQGKIPVWKRGGGAIRRNSIERKEGFFLFPLAPLSFRWFFTRCGAEDKRAVLWVELVDSPKGKAIDGLCVLWKMSV